jgi:hypothetical protein
MMPHEPVRDIIRRTMHNLKFVEERVWALRGDTTHKLLPRRACTPLGEIPGRSDRRVARDGARRRLASNCQG